MSIDRYNYQEFFFLYTDNELKVAERKAVEDFVQQNPDLEAELLMLKQSVLKPDAGVTFKNKELLLQFDNKANTINSGNFSLFAVAYADNELNDTDKAHLEEFIISNPQFQQEFYLIQSLKLSAGDVCVFPDKKQLYRYEKKKPVLLLWERMAAAAIIFLLAGWLWLNKRPASSTAPDLVQATTRPVPSKNSDIINKNPEKESNSLKTHTAPFIHQPAINEESLAASEKKSNPADKKVMLQKTPGNATTLTARTIDHQESPMSAHVSNRSLAELHNKPETMATIAGTIESANKTIAEQPVVKFNNINNTDYTAITVASTENDENTLLAHIDKNNSLRVILRKASRFLDKSTASRTSKKSGLHIGNIEIAFQ